MNGTENNDKKIKKYCFLGTVSFFGGDFGDLILYLGFWGLDLEIWSGKQMRKKGKNQKGRRNTLPTGG